MKRVVLLRGIYFLLFTIVMMIACRDKPAPQTSNRGYISGKGIYVRNAPGRKGTKRLFYLNYFDPVTVVQKKRLNNDNNEIWYQINTSKKKGVWILSTYVRYKHDLFSDRDLMYYTCHIKNQYNADVMPEPVERKIRAMLDDTQEQSVELLKVIPRCNQDNMSLLILAVKTPPTIDAYSSPDQILSHYSFRAFHYQPKTQTFSKTDLLLNAVQHLQENERYNNSRLKDVSVIETQDDLFFTFLSQKTKDYQKTVTRHYYSILRSFSVKPAGTVVIFDWDRKKKQKIMGTIVYRHWHSNKRRIWANYRLSSAKRDKDLYYRISYRIMNGRLLREFKKITQ